MPARLESTLVAAPRGERVFNHGDFHPGNLLWRRDGLSGIVDWGHAKAAGYRGW